MATPYVSTFGRLPGGTDNAGWRDADGRDIGYRIAGSGDQKQQQGQHAGEIGFGHVAAHIRGDKKFETTELKLRRSSAKYSGG